MDIAKSIIILYTDIKFWKNLHEKVTQDVKRMENPNCKYLPYQGRDIELYTLHDLMEK